MVVQVDNPANKHMHNGDTPVVKTIDAPGFLPKRYLYSDYEAQKRFNALQTDIYETQKHTKAPDRRKFPTVLKIIIAAGTLALGVIFRKDLAKFVKGLFKKPTTP
jgi:hypothetical protein